MTGRHRSDLLLRKTKLERFSLPSSSLVMPMAGKLLLPKQNDGLSSDRLPVAEDKAGAFKQLRSQAELGNEGESM